MASFSLAGSTETYRSSVSMGCTFWVTTLSLLSCITLRFIRLTARRRGSDSNAPISSRCGSNWSMGIYAEKPDMFFENLFRDEFTFLSSRM